MSCLHGRADEATCSPTRGGLSSTPAGVLPGSGLPTGANQAGLVREDDELCTIACTELDHRSADMCLGSCAAHEQTLADLLVVEPTGDQRHHLTFPLGQHREVGALERLLGAAGELFDQAPGDTR